MSTPLNDAQSSVERLTGEVRALVGREFRDRAEAAADRAEGAAGRAEGAATALPATIDAELDTRVPQAVSAEITAQIDAGLPGKADTSYVNEQVATRAPLVHEHTASQIADLHHYSGTGFPEGKVTAPVGATYTDTAATNGAVRWIKTTGAGSTGWQVEYGDTGWRNVSSALADVLESGKVFFRRRGDVVDIVTEWAKFIPAGTTQMPAGFRPFRNDAVPFYASANLDTPVAQLRITYTGNITINVFDDRYSANDQGALATSDPWPTSLPGTPA